MAALPRTCLLAALLTSAAFAAHHAAAAPPALASRVTGVTHAARAADQPLAADVAAAAHVSAAIHAAQADPAAPDAGAQGAQQVWEPLGPRWLLLIDRYGPWLLAALALLLLARALLHQRRYRATRALDARAQVAVHAALAAAERRTVGEIVPVVLERSDRHPGADWLSALTVLLLGSALLGRHLPWHAPLLLLASQGALGLAGFLLARALPGWKRLFVSEARADEMVREQAVQEFHSLRLHETQGRTGVLLLVSLLERRVVVLADEGIDREAGEQAWQRTRDAVLAGVRRGRLDEGLVEGVREAGEALARHAPWREGDRNEIPDRLVVRSE